MLQQTAQTVQKNVSQANDDAIAVDDDDDGNDEKTEAKIVQPTIAQESVHSFSDMCDDSVPSAHKLVVPWCC